VRRGRSRARTRHHTAAGNLRVPEVPPALWACIGRFGQLTSSSPV